MTIQEQLNAGEHIFSHIDDLIKEQKYQDAYEVIRNTDPPKEWISEFDSILKPGETYKTMKIELLEAIAWRIFKYWNIEDLSQPVFSVSKDKLSVTLVVKLGLRSFNGSEKMILTGIASEMAHSMAVLPLTTPKCLAMAKKQALKQLGNLFGLSLSRESEGEAVNYSKPAENPLVNDAILEINKCKTLEELTKVHNLCAKEVQNDPKFTDAILSQKKILTLTDKKDGNKP